jgi:hypothetical protein
MAEFRNDGYQSIRDFVNSSVANPPEWDYIEIYDDTESAVLRVSITGDTRCQWKDIDGDNILQVEITITGSDADITQPVTLEKSAIWDDTSANGGNQMTPKESFASVKINQDGDSVKITHNLNIPQ